MSNVARRIHPVIIARSISGWGGGLLGLLAGMVLSSCVGSSQAVTYIAINPVHPNVVFIATNDKVYKSRNDGETWVPVMTGLSNARIVSLAVHRVNTSTVYAGTLGDGVYRSTDGGNRWTIINAGMKEHVTYVNTFIFHPRNPETIFAGTTVGLFETKNGGLMWDEMSNKGMDSVYVVSAAIDPVDTETLYAGTSGGVYKTTDGARTWKAVNRGLIEGEFRTALALGVNSMVMDPADRKRLYIGTTKGAFKTEDGGVSWKEIQEGMGGRFVSSIVINPNASGTLYAGTQIGIFKTTDGGGIWTETSRGLTQANVRSMIMHPQDPEILYAGTQGGLFKTVDGGLNWKALLFRSKDSPGT